MRNKKLLHEVESRISEATQSRRSTDFGLSMSKRDYMEKVSEHVRSGRTSPNRRKFKPNSMMPLQPIQRPPVSVVDFLSERRKERLSHFSDSYSGTASSPVPKPKPKNTEAKIMTQALLLKEAADSGNMRSEKFIKTNQEMGELLLDTVKGKLQQLNSLLAK